MNDETTAAPASPIVAAVKQVIKPKAKKAPKAKAKVAAKKAKPAKKPAKAKAKGADERLVPADLDKYTKDTEHKTAGGNVSIHCGDKTAKALVGLTLDAVYKQAAKTLKEPEADLRKKYKHLNAGMQRMNLGNRMRVA